MGLSNGWGRTALIAGIALTIGVAGTATAASLITSADIKNGTIQNIDVKTGALTGLKVKNKSLTAKDIKPTIAGPTVVTSLGIGGTNTSNPGMAFTEVEGVGTFTKQRNNSLVRLDWTSHANVVGPMDVGAALLFCEYQLRIDGKVADGTAPASSGSPFAVIGEGVNSFSLSGVFTGVGKGDHEVTVWLREGASSCVLNAGNFSQTVFVTEFDGTQGTGTSARQAGPGRAGAKH